MAPPHPSRTLKAQLDFRELSEQFARTLIYVIGSARGGSTFANRVVGLHPNLLYVQWNDKTFSDIWPRIDTLSDDELRRRLFRPSEDHQAIGIQHIDGETLTLWNRHVDHVLATRNLRAIFCLRGIFYWLTHASDCPLSELSGWCIKANTWEGVDKLKRAIPEARLVFVLRDPRSTALSFAKVYARRRREFFANHDLLRGTFNWLRNATEFAIRLNRYDDAHLLYFEELVSDPVTTLNALYAGLGLTNVTAAEVRQFLASIEYTNTKTHEEQGRPQTLAGVQASAIDRWRAQLSDEQLRWVCALASFGARYYGYELDYGVSASALRKALARAPEGSVFKYVGLYLYCTMRLASLPRLQNIASNVSCR